MPDANHGKTLFDQRIEYPLPVKPGVQDYVFYVPNDGYRKAAQFFLDKHYPHHVAHDISSLEDLIGTLHTDVTQGGVNQIREVIIVTHGNSFALLLPLVNNAADPFRSLSSDSLACLQQQMLDGTLDEFKTKRAAVISHLTAGSWITIRGCAFGLSLEGVYALYSFFGGNADVYAPRAFQFFGEQTIDPWSAEIFGSRFRNEQSFHEHLVRQRFEKRQHTPDRQVAICDVLSDPASFSAPFDISTRQLGQPKPAEYVSIVDSLNHFKTNTALEEQFTAHGFEDPLSARVFVNKKDSRWIVKDVVRNPPLDPPLEVNYLIGELVDTSQQTATLVAQARLAAPNDPRVRRAYRRVPIQLFLEDGEHSLFIGKLFAIAMTDEDDTDTQRQQEFAAFSSILDANSAHTQNFGDGAGHDLRSVFEKNGYKLSDSATINKGPNVQVSDRFEWKTWIVEDKPSFKIKLEHPPTGTRDDAGRLVRAHTLTVYENPSMEELERQHYYLSTWFGTSSDTPGVELPAYLDRLSIDDLIDLITHLRSPYKPENAYYLNHAIQAISRKGTFETWLRARHPDLANLVLTADPLLMLSSGEQSDLEDAVYRFDFNHFWSEAKASRRLPVAFVTDLFLENVERLAKKFGITDAQLCTAEALGVVPESPFTDRHGIQNPQLDLYFATTAAKLTVDRLSEDTDCVEFKKVIELWQQVQNLPVDQLRDALVSQVAADGKSYWDIILDLRSKYSLLRNMAKLTELTDVLAEVGVKLPSIPDPTSYYGMAKFVAEKVAKAAKWEVAAAIIAEIGLYELVFTVPMKMWLDFIQAMHDEAARERTLGRITGIRQWLRVLLDLTYRREADFPDDVKDLIVPVLATPTGVGEYYVTHYQDEAVEVDSERGYTLPKKRVLLNPDMFGNGYDDGVVAMNWAWWDLLRHAKQVMSDILYEAHLDSCKVKVLSDAQFLDLERLKARIIREFARQLLQELPAI